MVLDDESCGLRATLAHQLPRSFLYSGDFVGENVSNILDKMAASTEILPSIIGAAKSGRKNYYLRKFNKLSEYSQRRCGGNGGSNFAFNTGH